MLSRFAESLALPWVWVHGVGAARHTSDSNTAGVLLKQHYCPRGKGSIVKAPQSALFLAGQYVSATGLLAASAVIAVVWCAQWRAFVAGWLLFQGSTCPQRSYAKLPAAAVHTWTNIMKGVYFTESILHACGAVELETLQPAVLVPEALAGQVCLHSV